MKAVLKFGEQHMLIFFTARLRMGIQIHPKATHRILSESYADGRADVCADRYYLNQSRWFS
jgi:hypothetical protein